MTDDARFVLLDQASMNELGAFSTFEEAERTLLRFVSADARAADSLEIWDDQLDTKLAVDEEKIRRAAAAA